VQDDSSAAPSAYGARITNPATWFEPLQVIALTNIHCSAVACSCAGGTIAQPNPRGVAGQRRLRTAGNKA
jgi:hypothetical protein